MKVPSAVMKVANSLRQDFEGSSPSPFIGRFGYPNINIGLLSPMNRPDNIYEYDAPNDWARKNYNIEKIVGFRSSLINSRQKACIKPTSRFFEMIREIGMSSRPIDVEVNLRSKPKFKLQLDSFNSPRGPSGDIKKARLTSNSRVPTKIDKVVDDTDLKSVKALNYLFKKGFNENYLSKLLSVGTLGVKTDRKLVPTRWSITAVDDILSKNLIKKIKERPVLDYSSYFGSYLGNYYLVLFFPEVWSYELFETYAAGTSWNTSNKSAFSTDYEPYLGRKNYAEQCAGGYYTVRLAVLEKLRKMVLRKQ